MSYVIRHMVNFLIPAKSHNAGQSHDGVKKFSGVDDLLMRCHGDDHEIIESSPQ